MIISSTCSGVLFSVSSSTFLYESSSALYANIYDLHCVIFFKTLGPRHSSTREKNLWFFFLQLAALCLDVSFGMCFFFLGLSNLLIHFFGLFGEDFLFRGDCTTFLIRGGVGTSFSSKNSILETNSLLEVYSGDAYSGH